jgi:hypothetical protein
MGHKAGPEDRHIGFFQVCGIEKKGIVMKIIPYMVQCHDNHYDPPEQIDRLYTLAVVFQGVNQFKECL